LESEVFFSIELCGDKIFVGVVLEKGDQQGDEGWLREKFDFLNARKPCPKFLKNQICTFWGPQGLEPGLD
jgi:hypothetical protein